jgi:CDP-diacylglycerol--serine O-phosphatidyltransferase
VKKHIPNLFTCLNLFCGCIAVIMIFRFKPHTDSSEGLYHLERAAFLVFLAAFFDFLDGLSARVFKVHSDLGLQLDSLADMVTFGFVPGAILFQLLKMSDPSLIYADENFLRIFQFFPFVITIFSALRLAKFNIDERQTESFIGLPTPANTLLIVSLPLILLHDDFHLTGLIRNPYFIVILSVVMSYLLIAEIPLFSLKFKNFTWKQNKYQYILLISAVILFSIFIYVAIPLIILLFVFLSIIRNIETAKRKRSNIQSL